MSNYLIDTWAWIEYLKGSPAGEIAAAIIQDENNDCYTSSVCIAEISSKYLRENLDPLVAENAINNLTKVIDVDAAIAASAGKVHADLRKKISNLGLTDAIIIATAKKFGLKIVTGDKHFKEISNAVLIG